MSVGIHPLVIEAFEGHRRTFDAVAATLGSAIEGGARILCDSLRAGGTIYWCGNGGSAADSQHLSAELVGRFRRERRGLASVALSTDTSALTCVGNDYGFDEIFARQLQGLGRSGDVLVGITTSGNSPNVLKAAAQARANGMRVIALLGRDGGKLAGACDLPIVVPAVDTARIQEMHILIGHAMCDLVEASFSA